MAIEYPYSSIVDMLAYQVRQRPDQCCLLYPHPLHTNNYISITYKQFDNLLNRLANKLLTILPDLNGTRSDLFQTPVVSLLANSDVHYLLMIYSLLKLDISVFPLSTRNDTEAIQHLVEKANSSYLFVSSQYLKTAEEVKTNLNSSFHLQTIDDLYLTDDELVHQHEESWEKRFSGRQPSLNKEDELERAPLIFHSSGSTAFPKPIRLTCKRLLSTYFIYSSVDHEYWRNHDILLVWGPLYHLFAFCMTIIIWQAGGAYALPLTKMYPPRPTQLLLNIQCKEITKLVTVPYLLEQLIQLIRCSENQEYYYGLLQRLHFIGFSGASLSSELCQEIDDHHVQILSFVGGTETGVVMISDLKKNRKESTVEHWKWMKVPAIREPYIKIVSLANDNETECLKEIIFLSNDPFVTKSISNRADGSYSSGDLLYEHPEMPGYYQIQSRLDDILVHSNGEKTNPVSMEFKMKEHVIIENAIIFGHKRFCTGALVQLNVHEAMKYELNVIEEKVWLAVHHANQHSPEYAKIVQEMIKILPMDTVLRTTDKGNIMRKNILQQYAPTIENMYEKFLHGKDNGQHQRQHVASHSAIAIGNYLQKIMSSILSKPYASLNDHQVPFSTLSIDSLTITRLHRQICEKVIVIPKYLLYEYSSIDSLSKKLSSLIKSTNEWTSEKAVHKHIQNIVQNICDRIEINEYLSLTNELSKKIWNDIIKHDDSYKQTEDILNKYLEKIKQHVESDLNVKRCENTQQRILITGATGALGSWILHYLLENVQIEHCYCLIQGENAQQRLKEGFTRRQLNTSLLLENNSRFTLLTCKNYSQDQLGLSDDDYDQLKQNVTDIVHAGWKVNFNLSVKQFERDCIQNLYDLLKFAKSTSKRFHFISSIASANSGFQSVIKEERLKDSSKLATDNGYGQSKYIAEHMCYAVRDLWNVPTRVYRCGQLSGDTSHGVWKRSEMLPMMICVSETMGIMPRCNQVINWLPVNETAACIVDLVIDSTRQKMNDGTYIYHLMNSNSVDWQTFLNYLHDAGLQFSIVDKDYWLQCLKESQVNHPAMMLYEHYEKYLSKPSDQLVHFETVNTLKQTTLLQKCSKIHRKLMRLYLNYWHRCDDLIEEYTIQQ